MGSSLDVAGLVQKLMTAESQPLTKLDAQEAAVQVKISAYGTLRSALTSFHTAVKSLTDVSRFSATRVSVGDSTVGSASVQSGAAAGDYSLEVTNLAKNQKLKSKSFTNTTDTVGTGTLTIQYGTADGTNPFALNAQKATQTVQIDAAHSSLSGVRDAINAAKIGVTATIVNDGKGNRLVLSSKDTGAANGLRITVADSDTTNDNQTGLSALAYNPDAPVDAGKNMSQLVGAEDATLLIDGMLVTKSSNTITDAIDGVTLQLTKTNKDAPTTLSVSQDTGSVQAAVNSLVSAYNDLSKTLTSLGSYDATSKQAGPLQGDFTLRTIATELQRDMSSQVAGLTGRYTALPQIGVSFDRTGKLTLDTTKLQDALKNDPSSVQRLFTATGVASDPLVSYAGSTSSTVPGNYEVSVSQLATHGSATGSSAVGGLIINNTNDTLNLKINGISTTIGLAQKTYATAADLAAELQSKINGVTDLSAAGFTVNVTEAAGVLTIASDRFGSASSVTVTGGNGATNLLGSGPTTIAGLDVAGTIGGASAVGSEQTLTGVTGSKPVGLKLNITGGVTGSRGSVDYGVGIAALLDGVLSKLEVTKNSVATRVTSLQGQVTDIGKQRDAFNAHLTEVQARYTKQFSALDALLTQMQQTSSALSQQLASLPAIAK